MAEPAIASMTGFGRGTAENRHAAVSVELRSVNGKGLVLKLRLPGERMELEPKLEAQVRKRIERGSVQGQLRITVAGSTAAEPDLAVLARYRDAWKKGVKELGLEPAPPTMAHSSPSDANRSTVSRVTAMVPSIAALRSSGVRRCWAEPW